MKLDCIFTPQSTAILNCSCDYKNYRIVGNCAPLIILLCVQKQNVVSSLTENVKINQAKNSQLSKSFHLMWEHSGSVIECLTGGGRFEPHRRHYVVSLSKNILNPSLVLVQPRKTCSFITERLLMGLKESSETNKQSTVYSHVLIQRGRERPHPPSPLKNPKLYGFL